MFHNFHGVAMLAQEFARALVSAAATDAAATCQVLGIEPSEENRNLIYQLRLIAAHADDLEGLAYVAKIDDPTRETLSRWLASHEGRLWTDAMMQLAPGAVEIIHSSGRWKDDVDFWTLFTQIEPGTAFAVAY